MIPTSLILVGGVAVCSICGGAAFKQFAVTREPLWIVAGIIAYNLSNVGWLALINETGLARATALAASAQILGLTAFAAFTGERIALSGWLAAALVCLSILVSTMASEPKRIPDAAVEKPNGSASNASSSELSKLKHRGSK